MKTIGILIFPEAEELDVVGPWDVLAYWTRRHGEDGYAVTLVSEDGRPVDCAKGMTIGAHHSYETMPPLDVLIYPGGWGTRAHLTNEAQLDWVRAQRQQVPLMASVCTGALVYAAAGLLAGRPATTHWASLELLAELDPSIEVQPDARFVDDGDLVTSAGVSAGIDMALHVVHRLAGTDRAREVRRAIQYDPEPPV